MGISCKKYFGKDKGIMKRMENTLEKERQVLRSKSESERKFDKKRGKK